MCEMLAARRGTLLLCLYCQQHITYDFHGKTKTLGKNRSIKPFELRSWILKMYSYDNIQSMYIAFGHVMLFDCQIINKMPKYTPKCENNSIF